MAETPTRGDDSNGKTVDEAAVKASAELEAARELQNKAELEAAESVEGTETVEVAHTSEDAPTTGEVAKIENPAQPPKAELSFAEQLKQAAQESEDEDKRKAEEAKKAAEEAKKTANKAKADRKKVTLGKISEINERQAALVEAEKALEEIPESTRASIMDVYEKGRTERLEKIAELEADPGVQALKAKELSQEIYESNSWSELTQLLETAIINSWLKELPLVDGITPYHQLEVLKTNHPDLKDALDVLVGTIRNKLIEQIKELSSQVQTIDTAYDLNVFVRSLNEKGLVRNLHTKKEESTILIDLVQAANANHPKVEKALDSLVKSLQKAHIKFLNMLIDEVKKTTILSQVNIFINIAYKYGWIPEIPLNENGNISYHKIRACRIKKAPELRDLSRLLVKAFKDVIDNIFKDTNPKKKRVEKEVIADRQDEGVEEKENQTDNTRYVDEGFSNKPQLTRSKVDEDNGEEPGDNIGNR